MKRRWVDELPAIGDRLRTPVRTVERVWDDDNIARKRLARYLARGTHRAVGRDNALYRSGKANVDTISRPAWSSKRTQARPRSLPTSAWQVSNLALSLIDHRRDLEAPWCGRGIRCIMARAKLRRTSAGVAPPPS